MTQRFAPLMRFLSEVARRLGIAEHVYIVGGAPRNFLLGMPVKDLDVVVDSVALGKGRDSEWFAEHLQKAIPVKTSLTTNQYGVAILTVSDEWDLDGHDMKGEVIEIANARKESYGADPSSKGKGYKPHTIEPATIEEDVLRRDFTVNTLLWRLLDSENGPDASKVVDLTGKGKAHLDERVLRTPLDPDRTFSDDPTRMLRAVRFSVRYSLGISSDMAASIRRNAPKLKGMPWDAVRKILVDDILDAPNPRKSIALLQDLGLSDALREMMQAEPGFAAAMGRSLSDKEALLLLDLLDLDWAIRTPLSFLDRAGQAKLRALILSLPDAEGQALVEALKKPPINQTKLFAEFSIPPKERGKVTELARQHLLTEPALAQHPDRLEAAVAESLAAQTKTAAHRVVSRYLTKR